jgi:hypothetical protein
MFIVALFTIAKLWKQLRCPMTDERIKKMWWGYMVDGFHILTWNRTKVTLAIALSGLGRELRWRDNGAMSLTYNIRLIGIVTVSFPLYNKCTLIQIYKN